jgi:hypothetical protein
VIPKCPKLESHFQLLQKVAEGDEVGLDCWFLTARNVSENVTSA